MEQLKLQVCAIPLEIGSKQQLQEGNNNYNEYTIIENGKKVLITHNQPIHYHLLIVSRHQSFMTLIWTGIASSCGPAVTRSGRRGNASVTWTATACWHAHVTGCGYDSCFCRVYDRRLSFPRYSFQLSPLIRIF